MPDILGETKRMLKRLLLSSLLTVSLVSSSFLGGVFGPSAGGQQLHAQVPPTVCQWLYICNVTPYDSWCTWVEVCW